MKREYLYYVLLVVLFVLASVYQVRFSYSEEQSLKRSSEQIRWPLNTGRFSATVSGVAPEAEQAGLRVGDVLLEVNSRPYTGREVLYDAYHDTRPGDVLRVKVRHQQAEGAAAEEELQIRVQPVTDFATIGNWVYVLVLYVLMPVICMLLGFGVAVLKPREVNAWLLLVLLPLTLAYVIVVHRALDVRVVIRQGVRYAFARGGVVVLRSLIIIAIVLVMATQINRPDTRLVDIITITAVGVTLILLMRRLGERLIAWTDRRFFREAYNAEHILSELSEKVRTMVETGPLLETVARRISESLHVPRVALLLADDGVYRPAYVLGYEQPSEVAFSEEAATAGRLKQEG
ncbi:MAG TPA: hypothetical protein VNO14_17430 [Blastocatellia bacterium]|nr:hypothetical protein [Blastocatellia bacterium]